MARTTASANGFLRYAQTTIGFSPVLGLRAFIDVIAMIHLTATTPILVSTAPADFRKGVDGFVALCEYDLHQNPRSGTLFIFINRRATMIRILAYEHNGYWLMTKRLSQGRYRGWPQAGEAVSALQAVQLRQLLAGSLA